MNSEWHLVRCRVKASPAPTSTDDTPQRLAFYNAISQVLYDHGAGDHLHAQQRAQYRRDLAWAMFDALPATSTDDTLRARIEALCADEYALHYRWRTTEAAGDVDLFVRLSDLCAALTTPPAAAGD